MQSGHTLTACGKEDFDLSRVIVALVDRKRPSFSRDIKDLMKNGSSRYMYDPISLFTQKDISLTNSFVDCKVFGCEVVTVRSMTENVVWTEENCDELCYIFMQ